MPDNKTVHASSARGPLSRMAQFRLLWTLATKLPLAVESAIMHVLGLSELSRYLDLRSELIVVILRALLQPSMPRSISASQRLSIGNHPIKGRLWVSTYVASSPPETSVRDELIEAIYSMRDKNHPKPHVPVPDLAPVEAEWTGFRAAASREDPLPVMSEGEKYREMMKECTRPSTVLYFHGGAYYLCDPSTHRPVAAKLAELTGGRCYSVRYRLAPRDPFPAALQDALISYLTLLYPPPDAYHEAVSPEHIVFAGDSAGGNLALALLQLVLELRRRESLILWHGEIREVPLPAGVACTSPWLDLTQSDPQWDEASPTPFDYLPKPAAMRRAKIPPCDAWPATPPRTHLYANDDLIAHPLVSLVMAHSWKGAPPVYINTGWEILSPEDLWLARKLYDEGVTVVLEEYEAMPHVFPMILQSTHNARRCFQGWASFITAVTTQEDIKSSAMTIRAKTLEEVPLRFEDLQTVTEAEMRERVAFKVALDLKTNL